MSTEQLADFCITQVQQQSPLYQPLEFTFRIVDGRISVGLPSNTTTITDLKFFTTTASGRVIAQGDLGSEIGFDLGNGTVLTITNRFDQAACIITQVR